LRAHRGSSGRDLVREATEKLREGWLKFQRPAHEVEADLEHKRSASAAKKKRCEKERR
jgi:hypothetical protein